MNQNGVKREIKTNAEEGGKTRNEGKSETKANEEGGTK